MTSFQPKGLRWAMSTCGTSVPGACAPPAGAASRRSRPPEPVTSMVPSASQSKQNGRAVDRATTSRLPVSDPVTSAARISPATQSEHQKRPSCQRADSPMARSDSSVVISCARWLMHVEPAAARELIAVPAPIQRGRRSGVATTGASEQEGGQGHDDDGADHGTDEAAPVELVLVSDAEQAGEDPVAEGRAGEAEHGGQGPGFPPGHVLEGVVRHECTSDRSADQAEGQGCDQASDVHVSSRNRGADQETCQDGTADAPVWQRSLRRDSTPPGPQLNCPPGCDEHPIDGDPRSASGVRGPQLQGRPTRSLS